MRFIDITGRRFGKLLVVSQHPERRNKHVCWTCVCDCGKETVVTGGSLKSGLSKSCGCGVIESTIRRNTTHGMTGTAEFSIWKNMLSRCHNIKCPAYPNYGGRGIEVCAEWRESFESFFRDIGPRPSRHLTIDRRDNSLGYSKSNCFWATRLEQAKNTRRSKVWVVDGIEYETSIIAAQALGVSAGTISIWCSGNRKNKPRENCFSYLRYKE